MKYIRTKDGRIIKISDWENHLKLKVVKITESHFCELKLKVDKMYEDTETHKGYWYKTEIITKADSIKDLCDTYIITSKQGHIYDNYEYYDYELKKVLPQAKEECPDEDWNLYGCILVDGIIKQVAKMNEKGELELL